MSEERDNDGFGRCPVSGCDGWVSNGTCQKCGEDFNPRNPIPGTDHFYDWCWCEPRVDTVHAGEDR